MRTHTFTHTSCLPVCVTGFCHCWSHGTCSTPPKWPHSWQCCSNSVIISQGTKIETSATEALSNRFLCGSDITVSPRSAHTDTAGTQDLQHQREWHLRHSCMDGKNPCFSRDLSFVHYKSKCCALWRERRGWIITKRTSLRTTPEGLIWSSSKDERWQTEVENEAVHFS